jgi:myo-inositol-1(or 4)-monophosphatase
MSSTPESRASKADRSAADESHPPTDQTAPVESYSQTALLELATTLARDAGGLLLERFAGGRDLVSEADLASERLIRERLTRARPGDGFLGEEGGGQEGTSGLHWIVDPLDGTVNFLFAIPQWCVSVAVADELGALAGAVFDPCRNELFLATRDGPPLLNDSPIEASSREDLATAMVATGLAYDTDTRAAQADVLTRVIPRVRDIRRFGSAALDLAWTAAGRYDAYFERSVKPWDIAAGTLICERAGLIVRELPEHEHLPPGVLAASPALAQPLFELVH